MLEYETNHIHSMYDPALQEEPMLSFLDLALYGGKGEKFNAYGFKSYYWTY